MQWTTFFESLAQLEPNDEFVTGRPGGLSPELAGQMADDIVLATHCWITAVAQAP